MTCNAPSGPFTVSHRVPSTSGSFLESGMEVAGGNDGPGTAGAFEFSDAGGRAEAVADATFAVD